MSSRRRVIAWGIFVAWLSNVYRPAIFTAIAMFPSLAWLQDQRIQNLTEALASLRTTVTDLARIVATQSDMLHDADKREAIMEERMGRVTPHDR